MVTRTLARLTPESLAEPYPRPPDDVPVSCRLFLTHLAVHLGFHLGQAGYLRRIVTGDARSSAPLALKELGG
jgi:hypothetical protein